MLLKKVRISLLGLSSVLALTGELKADAEKSSPSESDQTSDEIELKARNLKRYHLKEGENLPPSPTHPESKSVFETNESVVPEDAMDWRKNLSESGFDFGVLYKGDVMATVDGGSEKKTHTLGNLDLKLTLDGEKLFGVSDFQIFAYALGTHGQQPSESSAAAYGVDNIENSAAVFKLYEFWVQKELFDKKLSILLGIHDLNSEFYVTDDSGLFLNPAFGIGNEFAQTGVNGPAIFPNAAPSIRLRYTHSSQVYLMVGAFNGEAGDTRAPHATSYRINKQDGALLVYEAAYLPFDEEGGTKYGLGYWNYTKDVESLKDAEKKAMNSGYYLLVNQKMSETISSFFRYGHAKPDLNEAESNSSFGFVVKSFWESRGDDAFGLAYTHIRKSDHLSFGDEVSPVKAKDTGIYELTYRAELMKGLAIQPNIQYLEYPSGDPSIRDATTYGARLELGF